MGKLGERKRTLTKFFILCKGRPWEIKKTRDYEEKKERGGDGGGKFQSGEGGFQSRTGNEVNFK
jgi:hypothetical protein